MRFRFTIARLMVVVLIAAVVLTAWRFAGNVSSNIIFNLTVAFLILATYQAKAAPGKDGAWWLGFATLGWVHLVLGAGTPWSRGFTFNLTFISGLVFWILAALVQFDQGGLNLSLNTEADIARAFILECLTSLIVGFLGALAFSFAWSIRAASQERPTARPRDGRSSPA
jgi:hypothetical protein